MQFILLNRKYKQAAQSHISNEWQTWVRIQTYMGSMFLLFQSNSLASEMIKFISGVAVLMCKFVSQQAPKLEATNE